MSCVLAQPGLLPLSQQQEVVDAPTQHLYHPPPAKHGASKGNGTHPGLGLLTDATAGKEKLELGKMHLGSNLRLQQCRSITVPCASLLLTFYRQFPKQGPAISGLYFSCNF